MTLAPPPSLPQVFILDLPEHGIVLKIDSLPSILSRFFKGVQYDTHGLFLKIVSVLSAG